MKLPNRLNLMGHEYVIEKKRMNAMARICYGPKKIFINKKIKSKEQIEFELYHELAHFYQYFFNCRHHEPELFCNCLARFMMCVFSQLQEKK